MRVHTTIVLIGGAIAHSRSPRLHNALFERYGLPYRYELMPLDRDAVAGAIERMKRADYRGANVTSPHKFAAMPALDWLSPEAERIGAANTILFEGGRALGYNTDAEGVARTLADEGALAQPYTANVIGTGGAAMAAVHALLEHPLLRRPRTLTVYSRSAERARDAVARWGGRAACGAIADYTPADLVIHATPVGMAATPGTPLHDEALAGTTLLFEMIYSPPETELMRAARRQGIRALGGDTMFVHQALEAFRIWTGIEPSITDVPDDLFEQPRR